MSVPKKRAGSLQSTQLAVACCRANSTHACMHVCVAIRSPQGSDGHTCAHGSADGANAEASMTQDSAVASRSIRLEESLKFRGPRRIQFLNENVATQ